MWDLGLSVFLALSGVSVVDSPRDCRDQPGLMGGYITGTNLIELCHANVHRADQDLERVLRHEMVHASGKFRSSGVADSRATAHLVGPLDHG